jgi:hypothetical protein
MAQTIQEKFDALPPELQREVESIIHSLLNKATSHKRKYLKQDWAGGLKKRKESTENNPPDEV